MPFSTLVKLPPKILVLFFQAVESFLEVSVIPSTFTELFIKGSDMPILLLVVFLTVSEVLPGTS